MVLHPQECRGSSRHPPEGEQTGAQVPQSAVLFLLPGETLPATSTWLPSSSAQPPETPPFPFSTVCISLTLNSPPACPQLGSPGSGQGRVPWQRRGLMAEGAEQEAEPEGDGT